MASTSLEKTFGQVGNRQTWTFSAWIKRAGLGTGQNIFASFPQSTDYQRIMFNSSDKLYNAEVGGGATAWEVETDAVYRDTSAWYHLVLRQDTTQSTANDRVRIYINNVQQTFSTNTQPVQNRGTIINTADVHKIGKGDTSEYFDGEMSHIHWCDGQSYAPTEFGEYDANGVWKIKTDVSVTYGTNGFFILKDGNSVTDQSGNSNNWTVAGGTLTNTEDNPSNIFCTLNPLSTSPTGIGSYFSNGNNTLIAPTGSPYDIACGSTLGVSSGKWYWEVKYTDADPSGFQAAGLGIYDSELAINTFGNLRSVSNSKSVIWDVRNDLWVNGSDTGDNYIATSGSILGFALDLDAGTLKIHENGTYYNSGNPVTSAIDTSKTYLILASANGGSNYASLFFNFGNGYFGTTAVASAGTNASGIGIFEYDVPTGYTALSTKGLNL